MAKKIVAIIPARKGSKGIKDKNIISVFGKPLIYYTILFAQSCDFIDRIVISTDSKKYKKISEKLGLTVNFLRPKYISKDNSLDISFFNHAINFLKRKENYKPDYIVQLRPTSPLRKIKDLKKMLNILLKNKRVDSIRSISLMEKNPYKVWQKNHKNVLKPIIKNKTSFKEPYNAPRQSLPNFYYQNGIYDIFKAKILKKNLISGKKILGYCTKEKLDIDTYRDLKNLKKFKKKFINFKKYIKV
jgi:CMP-N,N'-diacetyllegionaminic acid synthase